MWLPGARALFLLFLILPGCGKTLVFELPGDGGERATVQWTARSATDEAVWTRVQASSIGQWSERRDCTNGFCAEGRINLSNCKLPGTMATLPASIYSTPPVAIQLSKARDLALRIVHRYKLGVRTIGMGAVAGVVTTQALLELTGPSINLAHSFAGDSQEKTESIPVLADFVGGNLELKLTFTWFCSGDFSKEDDEFIWSVKSIELLGVVAPADSN